MQHQPAYHDHWIMPQSYKHSCCACVMIMHVQYERDASIRNMRNPHFILHSYHATCNVVNGYISHSNQVNSCGFSCSCNSTCIAQQQCLEHFIISRRTCSCPSALFASELAAALQHCSHLTPSAIRADPCEHDWKRMLMKQTTVSQIKIKNIGLK